MTRIPPKYQAASLDNCPDLKPDLLTPLRAWAAKPRGILFLHGVPGSGKTWCGLAILRTQPDGCFINEPDYLAHRRKVVSGERTWD